MSDALAAAEQLCKQHGLKLTKTRKQVLTYIWQSHKPLGAYTILELLANAQEGGRRVAPPTVYRALDFLQEVGLVHRIASLNAYIGCSSPKQHHQSHFLICKHCDSTAEIASSGISTAIAKAAEPTGFAVEQECVEVIGLCPRCREQSDE